MEIDENVIDRLAASGTDVNYEEDEELIEAYVNLFKELEKRGCDSSILSLGSSLHELKTNDKTKCILIALINKYFRDTMLKLIE